jgi:hypothetical protein
MTDNLPPSSADVTESGNLNLPEPHRPVMGLLYFYLFIPKFKVIKDIAMCRYRTSVYRHNQC